MKFVAFINAQRHPSSWVAHGQPLVRPKVSVQLDEA